MLVTKPDGKRPLGSFRHRWEGNIRLDHEEIGWEGVDCIHVAQDRDQWWAILKTVMNLQVP
jgi:hypothetical protein